MSSSSLSWSSVFRYFTLAACLSGASVPRLSADAVTPAAPASVPAGETAVERFERRIGGRADQIMTRLALSDAIVVTRTRASVVKFYRDLDAAHALRDEQFGKLVVGDAHQINRLYFNADKQAHHVYGEFVGALARDLSEAQIDAIKDWMTFDMLRLSIEEYDRMFPQMNAKQRTQLHRWLLQSREAAVIAGSAETKLDVFRVNKMRLHAYLAAQGFDVEPALATEAARKAALKKSE